MAAYTSEKRQCKKEQQMRRDALSQAYKYAAVALSLAGNAFLLNKALILLGIVKG